MALYFQDISREIQGVIEEGRGEAAGFLEIDWVKEQLLESFGFAPFPGTLNLKLSPEGFDYVRQVVFARGTRLIPPVSQGDFCEARVLSIKIEDIPSALLFPMVDHYYENTVEIIAPLQLKSALGIGTGDPLNFSLQIPPKLSAPRGIIFDLDGTLFDSVEIFYNIICQSCRELNLTVPPREETMRLMGCGKGLWNTWDNLVMTEQASEDKDHFIKKCMESFENIWQQRYEQEVRLFEGVKELLDALKMADVKMGIVTSSYYSHKMDLFTRNGIDYRSIFHSIVTRHDTENNKPHPEPILKCLQEMNIEPGDCISIGDSPCDVIASNKSGVSSVGVLTGTGTVETLSKEGVDVLLDDVAKLPLLIEI